MYFCGELCLVQCLKMNDCITVLLKCCIEMYYKVFTESYVYKKYTYVWKQCLESCSMVAANSIMSFFLHLYFDIAF